MLKEETRRKKRSSLREKRSVMSMVTVIISKSIPKKRTENKTKLVKVLVARVVERFGIGILANIVEKENNTSFIVTNKDMLKDESNVNDNAN